VGVTLAHEGKIEEANMMVGLETYAPNNLLIGVTRLELQEEIVLEKREVRRNPEEDLVEMDENSDLKNGVGVKVNQLNLVVVHGGNRRLKYQTRTGRRR
jgi:hypothetical protein